MQDCQFVAKEYQLNYDPTKYPQSNGEEADDDNDDDFDDDDEEDDGATKKEK